MLPEMQKASSKTQKRFKKATHAVMAFNRLQQFGRDVGSFGVPAVPSSSHAHAPGCCVCGHRLRAASARGAPGRACPIWALTSAPRADTAGLQAEEPECEEAEPDNGHLTVDHNFDLPVRAVWRGGARAIWGCPRGAADAVGVV